MTISKAVLERLKAVSGVTSKVGSGSNARIYPSAAPKDAGYPFIVFSIISGEHAHHTGLSGFKVSGLARKRVQLDCIGLSPNAVDQLADSVRLALDGFRGSVGGMDVRSSMLTDEQSLYDPAQDGSERHNYRHILDFDIWHVESVPS